MKFFYRCLAHSFLILFIIIICIPLYLAIVAASHDGSAMMQAPIPVLPGDCLLKNFKAVLFSGMRLLMASLLLPC